LVARRTTPENRKYPVPHKNKIGFPLGSELNYPLIAKWLE